MSVLSEKVRKGLYAAMNVSAVTNLATGGIHNDVAPIDAVYPLVTFSQVISVGKYTFGLTLNSEDFTWFIKAHVASDLAGNKEPQGLAEEILAAIEAALGQSFPLSALSATEIVIREGDLPHLSEQLTDKRIFTRGFRLRIVAHL